MEAEWKIEGYHRESYHLLIERSFGTEKEARDFGRKVRKTDKMVAILLQGEEPIGEVK